MTIQADNYFLPSISEEGQIRQRANGAFIENCFEEDGQTVFAAVPLFNDVSGLSPVGTDYKRLGCSNHSQDIAIAQRILLNR
jgi:hypothetical protein